MKPKVSIPQLRPIPGLPVAPDWPNVVIVNRRIVAPGADGEPMPTSEVLRYRVDTRTGDRIQ
ncbi:MAG: hypothetical protein KME14_26170 [Tildeniella torsiva UHER 1998/13D]|nr:hypothetical protein [Tildeniella torsiva UHER 1998/13D]